MSTPEPRSSLIEFPCDFPIKIMGARVDGFAQAMVEVVMRFDEGFDPSSVQMRPSSKGNYLSLTCTVKALSQSQLDDIYRALSSHPMVKLVL